MIWTIAQHEFLKLFKSGKIWKLLALSQFVLGFIFFWLIEDFIFKSQQSMLGATEIFGVTERVFHPLFAWTALFFLLITPLLATMSLTQERKSHTLEIYLLSPLTAKDIILGKFLGLFLVQLFLLLPLLVMPFLILASGSLDIGHFLAGLFGLILLFATTLSLGMFVSSFAKEPLIAALAIFVAFIVLSILEGMGQIFGPSVEWVAELALLYHCKNFLSGLINTKDIIYYAALSTLFLYFSMRRLEKEADHKERT